MAYPPKWPFCQDDKQPPNLGSPFIGAAIKNVRQHQDVKHYWIGYYCVCPVTVPIASRSETRTKSIECHKKYIYIYIHLLDLQPGQL